MKHSLWASSWIFSNPSGAGGREPKETLGWRTTRVTANFPSAFFSRKSYRCILVVIHDQPLASSDREKCQHVTARECRNICLFGIDQVRIPKVLGC